MSNQIRIGRIRPAALATLASLSLLTVAAGACAPTMGGGMAVPPPPPSSAFNADAFGWSTYQGQGSIEGRIAYSRGNTAYACTGSVALTPDTPYTRARFATLYGSTEQAAIPEAVVRARTVADPNADYRSFVRPTTCANNRFSLTGLPDGSWFIIAPVSAGGDRIVLMRRVETRGGRMISVTL
ncbi:MAG: hypothetical protein EBR82_26350 [Caulobacteraceae bacterium]|nr:hypothetical protein [Caulobacteraceae bacterium]